MTRIRSESVEAVKEAVDMIDLVSGRTQMKRAGGEWRGRCPFHEERTGSFWVNPRPRAARFTRSGATDA